MKKTKVILGVVSIMTLCLTACGKPNMSFEKAIDTATHSELREMMSNAEIYQQNFSISSNFSRNEDNIEANVNFSTNSKKNKKDSEGETQISRKMNASGDGDEGRETIALDGDAIVKYLSNAIYFKLNSLNINNPEDLDPDELGFDLNGIKGKRFSFELTEEILNEIKAKMPEDFDINKLQHNEEILQKNKENLQKFKDNLRRAINNDGSIVYNGIYSKFDGYNAYKFSIDKEKVFNATTEYVKTLVPEEYMDDYLEAIEEIDIDEVFEDLPFKNFEGYLVITGKEKVQIVIENLDIENDYSTTKINGTFGKDRYEFVIKEDGEDVFVLSAKLSRAHYDISIKFDDSEIIKGTITPKKSDGKIKIDFDLSINFGKDTNKTSIPLKGYWSWEKISKFNVEVPKDSKNLLEDIMKNIDYDAIDLQGLSLNSQGYGSSMLPAGILAAALTPRMQAAQGRARDVSRKTALSQIQTAIVTSQGDKGKWPGMDKGANRGITISTIEEEIQEAGMSTVPKDPDVYNINYGLGRNYRDDSIMGEYLYLVTKRNGTQNGGFVLMAKTEEEGGSNRVVCKNSSGLNKGYIINSDITEIQTCTSISQGNSCGINEGVCTYTDNDELRYILMY